MLRAVFYVIIAYTIGSQHSIYCHNIHRVTGVSLPATLRRGCELLALIFSLLIF
jgi:hypothetical protein